LSPRAKLLLAILPYLLFLITLCRCLCPCRCEIAMLLSCQIAASIIVMLFLSDGAADFHQGMEQGGGRVQMIIDPCLGVLFLDDPQFGQDAKLPLYSLQGKAGLMHDLPLVIRLPGMGAKKVENPRPRG